MTSWGEKVRLEDEDDDGDEEESGSLVKSFRAQLLLARPTVSNPTLSGFQAQARLEPPPAARRSRRKQQEH
jgi:hypothetical protein